MFRVALWEPEIPPNTGAIARLCAAIGAPLHLIGKPKFRLDERSLRRAGLDYWEFVTIVRHASLSEFEAVVKEDAARLVCFSVRGGCQYTQFAFAPGDYLLFGNESRGLPETFLARHAERSVRIPIPTGKVRSLNLAMAAAIGVYEALRQLEIA